jgi:hypothetical protein
MVNIFRLARLRQLHAEYIWKSVDASGSTVLYCLNDFRFLYYDIAGLYGTLLIGNFQTNNIDFSILTMNRNNKRILGDRRKKGRISSS